MEKAEKETHEHDIFITKFLQININYTLECDNK